MRRGIDQSHKRENQVEPLVVVQMVHVASLSLVYSTTRERERDEEKLKVKVKSSGKNIFEVEEGIRTLFPLKQTSRFSLKFIA